MVSRVVELMRMLPVRKPMIILLQGVITMFMDGGTRMSMNTNKMASAFAEAILFHRLFADHDIDVVSCSLEIVGGEFGHLIRVVGSAAEHIEVDRTAGIREMC